MTTNLYINLHVNNAFFITCGQNTINYIIVVFMVVIWKKNNFKKITFTCGWARQNIFLVKIVVWIVVWSKTRYNILVKIMVGIVVVYKMTKKKHKFLSYF